MRRPTGCPTPPACNGNGNTSPDICICGEDTIVRADMNIIEWFSVQISGKITNQCNLPAKNVVLRLLRVSGDRTREVAQTRTDDSGYYCFSLRTTDCHACYRIVALESDMGQAEECEYRRPCKHHHHHDRDDCQDPQPDC